MDDNFRISAKNSLSRSCQCAGCRDPKVVEVADVGYSADYRPYRVQILQEAMRKTFSDPEFHKEFKKLTGDDPTPLMPETHEKIIKDLPRNPEVIELFKKLAGADPLPSR